MAKTNLTKNERALVRAKEKGYKVTKSGEVLSPSGKKRKLSVHDGYYRFNIGFGDESYPVRVHRLQAYQKFGDKYLKSDLQARHLDGDSKNNSWDNIAIGTQSENMMDKPKKQRIEHARQGAPNKLTSKQVKEIREKVENDNYKTYSDLASEYGIKSKGNISDIVNGNTWQHI